MDIYKNHRKLILYSLVVIIAIFLILIIPIIIYFLFSHKMVSLYVVPILFLIASIGLVIAIYKVLKKLDLHPRDDFINFLSYHDLKIKFYKYVTSALKFFNMVILILVLLLLFISLLIFITGSIIVVINAFKANNSTLPDVSLINSIMQFGLYIFGISFSIFILIAFGGIIIFNYILPSNKLSGLPDTSDIVISFIKKAIDEINSFDFSLTWDDTKKNKNKISNFINDTLEFITIEDKFFGIPIGWRYSQQFIAGLNNKSAKLDILYRINGLCEELNEIIVELNCINTVKDKEDVANKLNKYLIIIENKNLCELKKVYFKKYNVIWNSTEKIFNLFFYFIKIIFRF